jgi:uncharacterized protein (DUF58 family)
MRPTRLGLFAVAMAGFTLFAAGSTGNNLLYMLFAATAAGLFLALAAGWANLRGLAARLEPPAQMFRGSAFQAVVIVDNPRATAARFVRAVGPREPASEGDGAPRPINLLRVLGGFALVFGAIGWYMRRPGNRLLYFLFGLGDKLLYVLFALSVATSIVAMALIARSAWWRKLGARPDAAGPAPRRAATATAPIGDVPAGGSARAELKLTLPFRGLNRVDGLVLESLYPFGFFISRRRVAPAELLALPPASPFYPQTELELDPRAYGGAAARRKAREGEFFGPRPYAPEDDAREIHWKLTAKSGRPVVAEHAAAPDGKAVVRLDGTDDASVERAAAACRWHIDAGAETGLAGPGVEVAPARGLGQLDRLLRALALVGDGARPRSSPGAPPARDSGPVDSAAVRRLLYTGGALVYLSLFLIEELNARALLACALVIPLGVFVQERDGPFLTPWISNVLSLGMLGFLVLVDWRRSGVALANTHLLGYLLANRALSRWDARELRQVFLILYLAFFLVSGLTISPWYFPLFVAWSAFCGAWLMLQAGASPTRPARWLGPLGRLLAVGAALGAAVFVVVPRVEGLRRFNPFAASGMDKLQVRSQSVVGFTQNVTLGYFGHLRRSPARVMRVRVPAMLRAEPPPIYVRGAALDRFDGSSWSKNSLDFRYRAGGRSLAAFRDRAWVSPRGIDLLFPLPPTPQTDPEYEIELLPMQISVLFTIGAPRLVEGVGQSVWFDHTDSVYAASPFAAGAHYKLVSAAAGLQPTDAAEDLRDRALEQALQTPDDPGGRVAALAASWTRGLTDPQAKAEAVVSRLRREYSYSDFSDGTRTSLPDFLFDVRRGNCEYFATAAAILLRHAGVPTRIVTGFHADEWNEWGRFYDVRQSQAHAWTEAWIPGKGWLTYDATPAESGLSAAADEFSRRVGRWFDVLQARWYRSVVGYDQYSQRDAFLSMSFARVFDGISKFADRLFERGLPVVLVLGLAFLAWKARPSLRRPVDEYESAERALARAGVRRAPAQTPREFARAVSAARPELAALADLAEAHYRRRYAGLAPGSDDRRRAAELLRELKSRL